MRTIRATSFSAKREADGFAYFTVEFELDGVKHQRREIYSGELRFDRVFYGDLAKYGVTVLFPWAKKDSNKTDKLRGATLHFVGAFETVFSDDWEYSASSLRDQDQHFFIAPGATFLNPEIPDEGNNWAARGELLSAYRELKKMLSATNPQ